MLQISCPWCGPRDEVEFRCGGQSHIIRPGPPEVVDDVTWGKYLSEKINPRGEHLERWQHHAGCRRWFNAARDTATHRIRVTYHMTEAAPAVSLGDVAP
jgi:sarcosine oxidase subunit delta